MFYLLGAFLPLGVCLCEGGTRGLYVASHQIGWFLFSWMSKRRSVWRIILSGKFPTTTTTKPTTRTTMAANQTSPITTSLTISLFRRPTAGRVDNTHIFLYVIYTVHGSVMVHCGVKRFDRSTVQLAEQPHDLNARGGAEVCMKFLKMFTNASDFVHRALCAWQLLSFNVCRSRGPKHCQRLQAGTQQHLKHFLVILAVSPFNQISRTFTARKDPYISLNSTASYSCDKRFHCGAKWNLGKHPILSLRSPGKLSLCDSFPCYKKVVLRHASSGTVQCLPADIIILKITNHWTINEQWNVIVLPVPDKTANSPAC